MRSAAPAGISLLKYLRQRGLARLEPSWSAPLFCWRFSGDFENRVYPLYRRSQVENCVTLVPLTAGVDPRTGVPVGGNCTWMEHPNNPAATHSR